MLAAETRFTTAPRAPYFQTNPQGAMTATASTVSTESIPVPQASTPAATTPVIEVVNPATGGPADLPASAYEEAPPWYRRRGVHLFVGGLLAGALATAILK